MKNMERDSDQNNGATEIVENVKSTLVKLGKSVKYKTSAMLQDVDEEMDDENSQAIHWPKSPITGIK